MRRFLVDILLITYFSYIYRYVLHVYSLCTLFLYLVEDLTQRIFMSSYMSVVEGNVRTDKLYLSYYLLHKAYSFHLFTRLNHITKLCLSCGSKSLATKAIPVCSLYTSRHYDGALLLTQSVPPLYPYKDYHS